MDKNKKLIDLLTLYINYLHLIEYHKKYGDKYGDTTKLIEIYEEELINNNIKIKKR